MKRALAFALAGLVVLASDHVVRADYVQGRTNGTPVSSGKEISLDGEAQEGALAALKATLEVERAVLKTQQDLYKRAAADRTVAERRVTALLSEMDALVEGSAPAPQPAPTTAGELIATKEREIGEAETARAAAIQRCREILGSIQQIEQRVAGLEDKVLAMRDTLPRRGESLSGSWRITLLPNNSRGVFALKQSGTIVQGQYQLDGGWRGSLQGTFIDGKILLQRIDSKLGRSSEFEGFLAQDGSSIRGTWRSYGLADGGVAAGSWTALRLDE